MTDRTPGPAGIAARVRRVAEALGARLGWADVVAALLAVAGGLVAAGVATQLFPYYSPNHDEGVYLQQAAMLLDGRLFLDPPVPESFRPWFFVRTPDGALYPKYAPVPAAVFALGTLLGGPRLALVGVAVGVVGLTHLTVREAFDARVGAVAAAFLLAAPLFVVQSGVFLPYAVTALFELLFAAAYLRGDRTGRCRWAALAGAAIGVAFFSRPYTATLFAGPFVLHAAWRIGRRRDDRSTVLGWLDRPALARNLLTAAGGLAGVAVALGYNAAVTGDPLTFPYQAFAPRDGIGFGRREILGHAVEYTPRLAVAANARVLAAFFTEWVAAGPVGSLLAATGIGLVGRRAVADGAVDSRRLAVAGLGVSVPLGNVFFWGNLNVLGDPTVAGDGLVASLGPYYHYDLLLPTAAFAAYALVVAGERATAVVRARSTGREAAAVTAAIALVTAAAVAVPAAAALAEPVQRNAATTAAYEQAYEPVEAQPFDDAVVFLPAPYGPWLNHPFQALRNDPGYEDDAVYALRENQFDVVDAFPGRTLYRYTYRGAWAPTAGRTVEPRLQRIRHVAGDRVTVEAGLGIPAEARSVSVRLSTDEGSALYAANGTADVLRLDLVVDGGGLRLDGPVDRVGGAASAPVEGRETVRLVVYVSTDGADAFSYRLDVPVVRQAGSVRALTPYAEVCTVPDWCGGEAAFVPGSTDDGVSVELSVRASKDSTARRGGRA
jgi:hypothetical protein